MEVHGVVTNYDGGGGTLNDVVKGWQHLHFYDIISIERQRTLNKTKELCTLSHLLHLKFYKISLI